MTRKWLRMAAFILIALPEPITTPIGIILLLVTFALGGQKRLSKFGDLEELVKRSIKRAESRSLALSILTKKPILFHTLNQTANNSPDSNTGIENSQPQYHNWFDNRAVSEKVLHHTLKTSLPQYEASYSNQIESPDFVPTENVVHHTLKTSPLRNPKSEHPIVQKTIIHHSLKLLPS
jgi:hypothetical protein